MAIYPFVGRGSCGVLGNQETAPNEACVLVAFLSSSLSFGVRPCAREDR